MRLLVKDYVDDVMKVDKFDFAHSDDYCDFSHTYVQVQIRLKDDWDLILDNAGLTWTEYFGDWAFTQNDKEKSKRFFAVA